MTARCSLCLSEPDTQRLPVERYMNGCSHGTSALTTGATRVSKSINSHGEKKQPTIQMKLRIHVCKTLPFCTNHTHAHTGNTNTRPINSAACTRPSHLSYKQMQAHWCISFHHNYWINNNHISKQEQAYVITQEWNSAGLLLANDWQVYIYTHSKKSLFISC